MKGEICMTYKSFEDMPMFITIPQAAEALGVTPPCIYTIISKDPSFPVLPLGRRKVIPVEQLKEWISKNCTRNES